MTSTPRPDTKRLRVAATSRTSSYRLSASMPAVHRVHRCVPATQPGQDVVVVGAEVEPGGPQPDVGPPPLPTSPSPTTVHLLDGPPGYPDLPVSDAVPGARRRSGVPAGRLVYTPPPMEPASQLPTPHLGARAADHPDRPAVVMSGIRHVTTYGQLDERSNRLAHAFRAAGLRPGDHLALMMANGSRSWRRPGGPAFGPLLHGPQQPSPPHRGPVHPGRLRGHVLRGHHPAWPDVAGPLDLGQVPIRLVVGGTLEGFASYETSSLAHPRAGGRRSRRTGDALLVRHHGRAQRRSQDPPGHAPRRPLAAPVQIAMGHRRPGIGPGPSTFPRTALPLGPPGLLHGHAPTRSHRRRHGDFDAADSLASIERHRVTHAQFVPTMFVRMLSLPRRNAGYDLSSLRYVVHAAAPCPVDVKHRMLEWWGPIIYEYYAGTEDIGSTSSRRRNG